MRSSEKPRVAVVGLSLEFYREKLPDFVERLRGQFGRFREEIESIAEVDVAELCCAEAEVEAAVRRAEVEDVDALLLLPLCYTASLTTLGPVLRTALPLVIWNTQEARAVREDYTADDLLMNHVAQGTQDLTNALLRSGRTFGMESGHYQDREALARLGEWLCAARAARFARELRVGVLGAPFQDMGDLSVDSTRMIRDWGPHTVQLSVGRFVRALQDATDAEADQLAERDRERFDVDAGVTPELHRVSARLEVALRRLAEEERLDALTLSFGDLIDDGRCPTMPFLGVNKLMADGLGYAGEGDAMTAAHMAQMRRLRGAATFTEIYTIDYERGRMMMTHMQECNPALARKDRKVRLIRKDFWAPGVEPYVGMHFTLEPGPVTLTAVSVDRNGDLFYVAHEARIEDIEPLPNYDTPHWIAVPALPVGDFLTRYSLAGGPHHLVAAPGRCADALRKLAHLQGIEFRLV